MKNIKMKMRQICTELCDVGRAILMICMEMEMI